MHVRLPGSSLLFIYLVPFVV
uniref:Uncharacterized protein n=1 Tax=Rhizophora mucronata TaxID=61149 RepID=A0A2P2PG16_RHIMU